MDILKTKLQTLKDISIEHESSLSSVQFVRDNYETMLDHLKSEITQRSLEQNLFRTKAGKDMRNLLLEHYSHLVHQIQTSYCQNQELFTHMLSQHNSLEDMINQTQPLVRQMDSLTIYTSKKNLKNILLKTAISKKEKQMMKGHNFKQQLYSSDRRRQNEQISRQYKINLLKIQNLGNQSLLKMSEKVWMDRVELLNNLADKCIGSLENMEFVSQKISSQSRKKSPSRNSSNNKDKTFVFAQKKHLVFTSNSQSLGLASKEEEINLHCYEKLDHMLVSKSELRINHGLPQINQYDQFQQSEDFTPRKALMDSNISFSSRPLQ